MQSAVHVPFQVASGTIIGADHVRVGRNNQDARCVLQDADRLVVVVCDGCSSGAGGIGVSSNEVGAQLGARVVANRLWEATHGGFDSSLAYVRSGVVNVLRDVHRAVGGTSEALYDLFLFTVVTAVVTRDFATFAAIGDGAVFVNGQRFPLGPFPDNQPPYLAYHLVSSRIDPHLLRFQQVARIPTAELQSFLIGTDGVDDLVAAAGEATVSGALVGPVERLWTEDRFFKNPDALRRHLLMANGGVMRKPPTHLKDDTTLVVGRRIPVPHAEVARG